MSLIHKTALIGSNVVIGENVSIGPYSIIEDNVKIGNDNVIKSSVFIAGNTDIDKSNTFYPFCSIGSPPQDLKFNNEVTRLVIGSNNTFREHSTVNVGTDGGGGLTSIGNNSLYIVMANQSTIAGHVIVDDHAILGGLSAVHQFCRIGSLSMIGGMSAVEHDVIPYGLVTGNRAHLLGLNIIGLRRAKYSNETIKDFKIIFEKIFKSNEIKTESIANENTTNILTKELIRFITSDSPRGLCSFK